MLSDCEGKTIASGDFIIKPSGFSIPAESARIHGISTERAIREGKELQWVLETFCALITQAEYLVAHNMSFDEKIVSAELLRKEMPDILLAKRKICTMQSTTDYCALPGPYGYKWPKLMELHCRLFKMDFKEAHNAAADVSAMTKCFWELKRLGIIKI